MYIYSIQYKYIEIYIYLLYTNFKIYLYIISLTFPLINSIKFTEVVDLHFLYNFFELNTFDVKRLKGMLVKFK